MKKYLLILGLVGLTGMIIQIGLLTIFLSFFSQSSVVSGVIIGGWIFGLSMGGLIVSKAEKIKNPNKYITFFQYGLGVLVLMFALFSDKIFPFLSKLSWMAFPLTFVFVTSIGLFSGTTFLLVNTINKTDKDKFTAKLYSAENFGASISSVLAGVLLLPFLGVKVSLISASLLCFGIGFKFSKKDRVTNYLPLLLIPILLFSFVGATETDFKEQSAFGEIEVKNGDLSINGRTQCSFNYLPEELSEKTIVNYSLSPSVEDPSVLNIGLGCGGTLNEIKKYTDNPIDIVEINPVVVKANKYSSNLLKDDQFNLIVEEGLGYLRKDSKLYDSIIIDIENPGVVHSSSIYTEKGFEIIKNALNEGGTFGLWMYPCGKGDYYDVTYNTLKTSFEYVYQLEEHLFVSSDVKLNYVPYVNYSSDTRTNTMDKKTLSTFFINHCWEWEE